MKTIHEIEVQKQKDVQFIISAVTSELYNLAYNEYFNTWENNGGMQWFFDECVNITNEIMFKEGSVYLKWLEYWIHNEDKYSKCFSEVTGEDCFDWYHMNEARKVFKSRYVKDDISDIKEQVSYSIGNILARYDSDVSDEIKLMVLDEEKKAREINQRMAKNEKVRDLISELNGLGLSNDDKKYIVEQLVTKK